MDFVEILESRSKQRNSKNFHEMTLIFQHSSMPSMERNESLYLKFYNKKQYTSLRLLLKVSNNKVSGEIFFSLLFGCPTVNFGPFSRDSPMLITAFM